jgi:hypothetical protein
MPALNAKHPAIQSYYEKRKALAAQNVKHELAVREAFKTLIVFDDFCCKYPLSA